MYRLFLLVFILCCTSSSFSQERPKHRKPSDARKLLTAKAYKAKKSHMRSKIKALQTMSKKSSPVASKKPTPKPKIDAGTFKTMSLTDTSMARQWIADYQDNNTNYGYPTSFLLNTKTLITYFNKATQSVNGRYYIHIYMSYNTDQNDLFTVILVPLVLNEQSNFIHDTAYKNVFGNCTPCPLCGVVPDNLDGPLTQNGTWNTNVPDCAMFKDIAKDYIAEYQNVNTDYYPDGTKFPESEYLDVTDLRNFILKKSIPFLQIYMAYRSQTTDLTLIFVGVDNTGNHVYSTTNQVFDECNPCPKCNITYDDDVDGGDQQVR